MLWFEKNRNNFEYKFHQYVMIWKKERNNFEYKFHQYVTVWKKKFEYISNFHPYVA